MQNRNPTLVQNEILRRRMFNSPVYNRNDPVGIMGSSPQLRRAVMRNRGGPQLASMNNINPLLLNASLTDVGGDAGGQRFTPTEVLSMPVEDGNPINPPASVVNRGGTGGGPQQQDPPVVGNVRPPSRNKDVTDQVTGPKRRPVRSTDLSQASLIKAMEKLIGNKSTEDFIKENRDLLEKYAPIPDKKNMRKQYLTKFFLDMAARGAQGDKPLAAAATAAPGTFDEYLAAEEKQKDRLAERDLLTVSMGLQDKKTQDASAQAINLKLLEIAADQPEKMKQVQALMDRGLSQEEALAKVFPDSKLGATAMQIQAFEDMGHSRSIAALMLNAQLLKDAVDNPTFFLNYLMNPKFARNKEDAKFLIAQAINAGGTEEDVLASLAVAGYTLNSVGQVVPKAS